MIFFDSKYSTLFKIAFCLLLSGCGNDKESKRLNGSWCFNESVSNLKLTFSENKIFTSKVSLIAEITIDHGIWTIVDKNELITKFQDGDNQIRNHYTFSFSQNKLTLVNTDDDETKKSMFNYMSFLSDDSKTLELFRCNDQN